MTDDENVTVSQLADDPVSLARRCWDELHEEFVRRHDLSYRALAKQLGRELREQAPVAHTTLQSWFQTRQSLPDKLVFLALVRVLGLDEQQWARRWEEWDNTRIRVTVDLPPQDTAPKDPALQPIRSRWQQFRSNLLAIVLAIVVGILINGLSTSPARGPIPVADPQWIPLRHWYSHRTQDNLTTTEDHWNAAKGFTTPDGYRQDEIVGYILDPKEQQTHCMVQLVRFEGVRFDSEIDHATTSDPAWITLDGAPPTSYVQRSVVGYIYNPNLPQPPETDPLYRFYSEGRQDFLTSAKPKWRDETYVAEKGYAGKRLEGYIAKPGTKPPPCAIARPSVDLRHETTGRPSLPTSSR